MRYLHFGLFQGEGVAYRGRVLVELSTQLDGKVDKNVEDISSDGILVAQVYMQSYCNYGCQLIYLIYITTHKIHGPRLWTCGLSFIARVLNSVITLCVLTENTSR